MMDDDSQPSPLSTSAAGAIPRTLPRLVLGVALAAAAADAATKSWAAAVLDDTTIDLPGGLVLQESRNSGAAFSLATDGTVLITLVAIAVVAFIAFHSRSVTSPAYAVGLGLVGGGATGNLLDRLLRSPGPFRGAVVDWIDLGWFPSFNLADTWITLGAAVLVLLSLRTPPAARDSDGPPP